MTISLNPLIKNVRRALSDVSDDYLTNQQILDELQKAQVFCDALIIPTTSDEYKGKCYIAVATYYAYINYTTLAEKQIGTLPPTSQVRLKALRHVAVSFLQLVSMYPLTDDMLLDNKSYGKALTIAATLTHSVAEDE